MERIAAASNLIIEVEPQSWRLISNGGGDERLLVEAVPGEPLRYGENFGSRRQLPASGLLPREDIQRVVLGWSAKDDAWHLGLVLAGDLVTERGSRWIGLVHWHDPHTNQYFKVATQAGQMLAEQMGRPFSVIPPHTNAATAPTADEAPQYAPPARVEPISPFARPQEPLEESLQAARSYEAPARTPSLYESPSYEPIAEAIPQPSLPLKFELWTLKQADPARLELVLSKAWGRSRIMRVAWNIVWLAVFILLTVTTLTSGIAYPRPEILVYLGVAAIVLLVLVIFYNLFTTLTATNRIIIEREGVRWQRGKRVKKAVPADQIAEVYVSHVVSKVGRRGKSAQERAIHHGEINLYMMDGEFKSLLVQPQTDETVLVVNDPLNEESIFPLTVYNARTRLQAAALKIAQTLNLPAEYDKRMK